MCNILMLYIRFIKKHPSRIMLVSNLDQTLSYGHCDIPVS